jgi:hypothetical protein
MPQILLITPNDWSFMTIVADELRFLSYHAQIDWQPAPHGAFMALIDARLLGIDHTIEPIITVVVRYTDSSTQSISLDEVDDYRSAVMEADIDRLADLIGCVDVGDDNSDMDYYDAIDEHYGLE